MSTPVAEHADSPPHRPRPIGPGADVPWALPGDWPKGPVRDLEGLPWKHEAGPFAVHGFRFSIRTTMPVLGEHFDDLLGHLRTSVADHRYSIADPVARGRRRVGLYLDDRVLRYPIDTATAYRHLLWHLNRMAIHAASDKLVFHAAAATWKGGALLLPAPMESGKTTLVAGLVRAGLGYLTDEAAAVDLDRYEVHPYAKPLSIDPGSWPILPHLRPELSRELESLRLVQWQVPPDRIRRGATATATATPARWIVFPRYATGERTRIRRISGVDALLHLGRSSFNLAGHGRRGFHGAVELVRRCACFELVMSDLTAASAAVMEAVDA